MRMSVEQFLSRESRKRSQREGVAPAKTPAKPRVDHEHREQVALMKWSESAKVAYPSLKWLHAIPNGGKRSKAMAGKLKAEGVKRGVLDLFLPAARAGWHGLYIEMKYGDNTATPPQVDFIADMAREGYACYVCYSWKAARDCILAYLDGSPKAGVQHC